MIVIGCDPGVTGALSLFLGGSILQLRDIPNTTTQTEAKGAEIRDLIGGPAVHRSTRINVYALAALLREWSEGHGVRLIREDVHPRGGQGAVTSGVLMESVGLIDGAAAALGISIEKVDPSVWKRAMGLTDNKALSCKKAAETFPRWADSFRRRSIDHNRAEAALLGLYGVCHLQKT